MYQAVIVDDEPIIVDGIAKAIDWSGFHIEVACAATDPQEALNYILSHPVHIVITDVSMPGLDGLQLIQKAKQSKPNLYVVVLSAYDNFEYVRTALRCGAENYLLKPLDPDELSDTISQIISHIQEREQLSQTYGQSMMTFRSAFTEQWVKNLLGGSDLVSRAELLGINLDADSFTSVIFSCPDGNETAMSRFFDRLLYHLPGHFTGNFFFETPSRLVSVLSPISHAEESVCDFLLPILTLMRNSEIPVFASIGTTVSGYSEVPKSYQQAVSFSFLEYADLSCAVYQEEPAITSSVQDALKALPCDCSTVSPVAVLFDRYDPEICCRHVLSQWIASICREEYQLSDKYPQLAGLLPGYPKALSAAASDYRDFTLRFLTESFPVISKSQQTSYPMVDAVLKIIHEFSDKDISLKTLAAKLNVTPSYLGTMFRQQTGYYFNDYLADARLRYAAELLENTDLKIKDIVDRIGFSSQTYFNRSFKRFFGTSPVTWRRDKKLKEL
ncbi:MAG: response regulator [Lachnospiraceae bacterium]|nr:response regulator [Lachnospiraceae bacterium]